MHLSFKVSIKDLISFYIIHKNQLNYNIIKKLPELYVNNMNKSENQDNILDSETKADIKAIDVVDIIKNKTKFQIYNLFEIYGKFTLSELTNKLKKSKSTVFKHLKDLMNVGILKMNQIEKTVKKKIIRENMYELSDNYEELLEYNLKPNFDFSKPASKEEAREFIEDSLAITKRLSWFFEQQIEFFNKLLQSGPDEEAQQILFEIIHAQQDEKGNPKKTAAGKPMIESELLFSWNYITKSDLKRFISLLRKHKIKEEKKGEFPILLLASSIPMKKIIEYSLKH